MTTLQLLKALFLMATMMGVPSCTSAQNTTGTLTISVKFEYRLDVPDSRVVGNNTEVVSAIDELILGQLQEMLPDTDSTGTRLFEFVSIQSQIYNSCFTTSDECSVIRSNLVIDFQAAKPEHAVEVVTLEFVQNFFEGISTTDTGVTASYSYPSVVSTIAKFQMSPVPGSMPDLETQILEVSFMEVFGTIVFSLEGDTEVRDTKFLYQDLFFTNKSSITADLRVSGFCRECTSVEFEKVVGDVAKENIPAFMAKLKANANLLGSTYFDAVRDIVFSLPYPPESLGPVTDPSIFDEKTPIIESRQPWYLWFGIAMAILILCAGCYFVVKDSIAEEKDEYSTGGSSEDGDDCESEDSEAVYSEECRNFHQITVRRNDEQRGR